MRVIVFLVLLAVASPAFASDLICKNPGHEYLVRYTAGAETVTVNPDSQAVSQKVVARAKGLLVLDLGQRGMASILHLVGNKRNDIFVDGTLIQTDICH